METIFILFEIKFIKERITSIYKILQSRITADQLLPNRFFLFLCTLDCSEVGYSFLFVVRRTFAVCFKIINFFWSSRYNYKIARSTCCITVIDINWVQDTWNWAAQQFVWTKPMVKLFIFWCINITILNIFNTV